MGTSAQKRHRKAGEPALDADSQTAAESARDEVVQILASAILRWIVEGHGSRAVARPRCDEGTIP